MAAQAFTKTARAHCNTCGERLTRTVAGNIIDFTHADGSHGCQRIEPYLAA